MYLFTSESVGSGHPDKVADQISDAILDAYLKQDPRSKVACETLVTTNRVIVSGEIHSSAQVDVERIIRDTVRSIGYDKDEYNFNADTLHIENLLHEQSSDIRQGVDREFDEAQGAGDQGIMFGYATNETDSYMPLTIELAHTLLKVVEVCRKEKLIPYLRPDAKSQFTVKYDNDNKPMYVTDIVLSVQHDDFADSEDVMYDAIVRDFWSVIYPRFIDRLSEKCCAYLEPRRFNLYINPTGKFVIGGPDGDTGLTGRKIIVDTYGGHGAHGGGAFSGKDPSKVDRSAAYAARHLAKNIVAAGLCDRCLVQLSYAIGMADPISILINTYGTNKTDYSDEELAQMIGTEYKCSPYEIEKRFSLRRPIYLRTATYGHFGRHSMELENGKYTFPWERLELVDELKKLL